MEINIGSEIGHLEGVVLHKPGIEIERMTPTNAHAALYSDILNLEVVNKEYTDFVKVLELFTKTYYIKDLLLEVLKNESVKRKLVEDSCIIAKRDFLINELMEMSSSELTTILIEGYEYKKGKHPKELSEDRFILKPLFNLFFTRDAASVIYNSVLIHAMASEVRARESLIMQTIFTEYFKAEYLSPADECRRISTEGGDFLIANQNILCIGVGQRTNYRGIQYLASQLSQKGKYYILAQELPAKPESFIHLDMVFTFLSKDECMMYEPLMMKKSGFESYKTTLFTAENGKILANEVPNMQVGLKNLGWDIKPIFCGGNMDRWSQDREQWHSGANFFAMDSGKIIGYARNVRTMEALSQAGYAVLPAEKIVSGEIKMADYSKFVIAFNGSELPRGGGGARCMTMPILRGKIDF